MKHVFITIIAGLLILACSVRHAAQQSNRLGRVQGTVVDLVSAQPLPNVRISLVGMDGYYSATTDESGRFTVADLPAGDYKVEAIRDGYFWKRRDSGPADLTLTLGQELRDVGLRLAKASAITGRVVDENGEPDRDAAVAVFRLEYRNGRRSLQPPRSASGSRSVSSTNARGEYRIYSLEPGEYYLKATSGKSLAYYPNAGDVNLAAPITVSAGRDFVGADFKLSRVTMYSLSFVVDGQGPPNPGQPYLDSLRIAIVPKDPNKLVESDRTVAMPTDGGKYQLPLVPGQYDLSLSSLLPGWSAGTTVNISDRDVDAGTLTARPGVSLKGTIRMADTRSELKAMRLNLLATNGILATAGAYTSSEGQFILENVAEGNYWITFPNLPSGVYIQSVRYGASVPDNADLSIGKQVEGSIEIVLAPGASVSGSVRNVRGEVLPYTPVLVFPSRGQQHPSRTLTTETDKNGSFTISGLAPGEYRALAWEDALPSLYRDPAFLATFAQRASTFTIQGSLPATTDVKAIP